MAEGPQQLLINNPDQKGGEFMTTRKRSILMKDYVDFMYDDEHAWPECSSTEYTEYIESSSSGFPQIMSLRKL